MHVPLPSLSITDRVTPLRKIKARKIYIIMQQHPWYFASQGFMICSSPLQVFKDLVPNCRGGEQFVNPRLVMVHLKGPIKYRYMLFRRGLDHKPFASKSTGTPQKNSEYSPLPLIPKLWSYKSTDAQMKLLLYCWRPCLAVTTTLFHFYFVFTRMHSHSTSFVHAQDMIC